MPRQVTSRTLSASVALTSLMLAIGLSGCGKTESSTTLLAEAKQYQQKGDSKAALIQLKNAASTSPEDAEVRLQLANLHNEMGDFVSAEKESRKAISLGLASARAMPELARALQAQGQDQKLLDEVRIDAAKPDPALLVYRGEAELALKAFAKAKASFEQALALEPTRSDALIGMARQAMLQNDTEAGNRYADLAVEKNPNNVDALMFKGALLRAQNKPADALAQYDKVLALRPQHRSAHIEKANVELGMAKFEAAQADLDAAGKITPGSLLVTYSQAILDFTQGKNAAALESVQKVLRGAPEHMPAILLAGAIELNLGSLQQAEQHLKKYVDASPNNLYARKLLAQVLLKRAQPADAVAALGPSLNGQSTDAQMLSLAGQSYMQSKDFEKASSYFEKASALEPQAALLHTSLGMSKLGQGDATKAISELEQGIAIDPKSFSAGAALAQAELGLKHYDKALAAALALEKQHPDSAEACNVSGVVYVNKGDIAKARGSFERALSLQPTNFRAVSSLAALDMQEKHPEAAAKRFEALLEKDKKNIGALMALAEIASLQGQTAKAIGWLERATTDNPEAVAPAMKLAAYYMNNKQSDKALTLARKLQTSQPADPEVLDLLGQIQAGTGDQAGALETYSKLVKVLPKSAPAWYRLASIHALMKNEAAASDDLKKAVALQPDFLQGQLGLAKLALIAKRPDDAVAIARQIGQQPGRASAGYLLEADILAAQQKAPQALALYEKALVLEKSPKLMIMIHRLMVQTGKQKEADLRLAQWQKDHPADLAVPMYLAESSIAKKQYGAAIGQLEAVLKQSPKNPVVMNNLAWCYEQEKSPKALPLAEEAYRLVDGNAAIIDTLATILTGQGNTTRSIPLYRKAIALAPGAAELRVHLATALVKAGDKPAARKELEQAVAAGNTFAEYDAAREMLKLL